MIQSGTDAGGVYRDMWQTLRSGRVWKGELQNRKEKTGGSTGVRRPSPRCATIVARWSTSWPSRRTSPSASARKTNSRSWPACSRRARRH
ncbi:hypothetical protein DSL92_01125 [Billgrantia gudaonensis]|uniref:Uncharacterized protein n=1 Tax=Billgrantia gudaonensis TaxID=376427 RepID=A0A432JLN7_9GAMM|nr:hypothetical protein DSL92_01125 [Halomonas gudaonensis]